MRVESHRARVKHYIDKKIPMQKNVGRIVKTDSDVGLKIEKGMNLWSATAIRKH